VSIQVAIEHKTIYRYDRAVELGPHIVRLRPAPHCRTPILSYSMKIQPEEHFLNWQQDPIGNYQARLLFNEPTKLFSVVVDLIADMTVINPFDFFVDPAVEDFPFEYDAELKEELAPYLKTESSPLLTDWLKDAPKDNIITIDLLIGMNKRVAESVGYSVRMEPGVQTPDVTLKRAIGSCRDSAWLLVHALRQRGIAARFVSGYLIQLKEDIEVVHGKRGPTHDFTDLHAWCEAYVPGAGWIGLDATSGLFVTEGHIPLACAAEPLSAAPITGGLMGDATKVKTELEFSNEIVRLHEPPRVTKPYSDEQWAAIDTLGKAVDVRLETNDARLTMGGEPTFVSATDMDADEWNITADGPTKHDLAVKLALRLADQFGSGCMIRHGQGKWYPGEPLPRWQIGIHWRTDGVDLWHDRSLLANPSKPGTTTIEQTKAFSEALIAGIGFDTGRLVAAYEDRVEQLLQEARLPGGDPPELVEPDPEDRRFRDSIERAKLIDELDSGLGDPAGFAFPLYRAAGTEAWVSGDWVLRRGHLFLLAGDGPMGFRLPLQALTWVPSAVEPEHSLFPHRAPLRDPYYTEPVGISTVIEVDDDKPPITTLCVELRDGHACVFLPPIADPDHGVELIGLIEEAAKKTSVPVIIEGYSPPKDHRLRSFDVTPDPGVIEINIHPSTSWDELTEKTFTLNEEARQVGLATEKFALDGLHTGTGGGSHLTLGGLTPPDSPFLRRPDLLRSLVTYWQHHPALSYLFSGRFIGPTSQAPRVDEARHENLYELETAFQEMDRLAAAGDPPAWQVDRLLRNLLTDLTGNTHRAEFCIDKMYNPGSESGRLGVVELRGFEMAPHPKMELVQSLLVRSLVSKFWADPYRGDLVRWGTELHDRFLLPWYAQEDIYDVINDLRRAGISFEREWLDPFLDFRFPVLGETLIDGVRMELRMAIEPWNVLGEESGSGATARYVDSSVERVQVRLDGMTPSRHQVLCNGVQVPLQPTGVPGTYVAGVRFRAWQPWSALHPTIGIHSPLVFDLVDKWSGRSLGGCTYHVVHPGGRHYDRFPVNAAEAEARRTNRFEAMGHTPGAIEIPELPRAGEYPRTLDLRRGPQAQPRAEPGAFSRRY
jgi:uncharacterized protein (DUF2126 family)/transglutaminase-like putative cysteine protease